MKIRISAGIILLVFVSFSTRLFAQDDAKKLTIPSSPAFSILNFEPTSVMKPTSNKDLATDVLNSFDKNGKLLMNLGLEVSPYWLQSRPYLTREAYLNPDPWHTFLQSFSLSAATVKDSAAGNNKLGVGFRFKLINGKPVSDLKNADRALQDIQTIQSDITIAKTFNGTIITTVKDAIDFIIDSTMKNQKYPLTTLTNIRSIAEKIVCSRYYSDNKEGIDSFLVALNNTMNDTKGEPLAKVATLTQQRIGFILEFAGATAYNMTNSNELERLGIWINASNYVSATDLFTFTARYMYHNSADTTLGNFDVGISYLKKGDKYNISAEYMLRWYQGQIPDINIAGQHISRSENDFSYRLAVQGAFLLTDAISINLSLGKEFNGPNISGSGFFSILGLNYSIFNQERVKL